MRELFMLDRDGKKKLAKEVKKTFGQAAVVNLFCILRKEIDHFAGTDSLIIEVYCRRYANALLEA